MAFVTDLIWRSPLGLRINAQATADIQATEDWVKVRGDQLAARDGAYDLRVTAELWETHFFDRLALGYVDHPAGTEVFVDERFAVPAPPLDLVATDPVRAFASVRDDRGHDVADVVAARDDRHLDFAGRGAYQGITRDHFVELAVPEDAPRERPAVADRARVGAPHRQLRERRHLPGRACRAQEPVAARGGRLRPVPQVRPGLGFPSGKDKTVRIDLAGVFPPTGPRRLRLATNLEVFWDRLGWAAGRPDVRPADGPAAASIGRLAIPWVLGDRTTRRQHS